MRDPFGRGAAGDDEVLVFFDLFGRAALDPFVLRRMPCQHGFIPAYAT